MKSDADALNIFLREFLVIHFYWAMGDAFSIKFILWLLSINV
jgi:hypothetical protein